MWSNMLPFVFGGGDGGVVDGVVFGVIGVVDDVVVVVDDAGRAGKKIKKVVLFWSLR